MARTTFSGPVVSLGGFGTGNGQFSPVTASTLTIDDSYNGLTVVLNRAAGTTVTLPAATGSGATYRFFVGTTVSSNNDIIKVANSTDVMAGNAVVGATTSGTFATAASSDTITMNGTTKGGIIGSSVTLVDVASGVWAVSADLVGSGTAGTPFSATV